jgi:hypothetical protein
MQAAARNEGAIKICTLTPEDAQEAFYPREHMQYV